MKLGDMMGDGADALRAMVKDYEAEAKRKKKAREEEKKRRMGKTIKYEKKD